jgi:hypothetical protein
MPSKTSSSRSRSSASSQSTRDHEKIRAWVEERGGRPACVRGTGGKTDTGLLRIDFPGYGDDQKLAPISWEDFFEKFEEQKLAMVYQDQTKDGETSRFSKLVKRSSVGRKSAGGRGAPSRSKSSGGRASAKARPGSRAGERAGRSRASTTPRKSSKSRR